MKRCMGCMREYDEKRTECPVCGYPSEYCEEERVKYPDALLPGTILSHRFVIGRVMNGNDFSYVYIAWDELLKRKVAIKEYFPVDLAVRAEDRVTVHPVADYLEIFDNGKIAFRDETVLLHEHQEIRTIAAVYRCLEENNTIYMVMEYLKGCTLTDLIYDDFEQGDMKYDKKEILKNLVIAVMRIQDNNIPHLHLSPDNIYIEDDSEYSVRLLGFSYAHFTVYYQYPTIGSTFNRCFCAPEMLKRRSPKTTADLYSLGCIVYYFMTNKLPEESLSRLRTHRKLKTGRKNDELTDLINRMAHETVSKRSVDWNQLLMLIERM